MFRALAQASDSQSTNPSAGAHRRDAPRPLHKAPGRRLLLALRLWNQRFPSAPSLSPISFRPPYEKSLFERHAHANAETLSLPLTCWKGLKGVKLRTWFLVKRRYGSRSGAPELSAQSAIQCRLVEGIYPNGISSGHLLELGRRWISELLHSYLDAPSNSRR